jgi:putative salt-induced outer membrane protein YdiY
MEGEASVKTFRTFQIIGVIIILFSAGGVFADELWLKNGDHLTGDVVRMENKVLIFKTAYAGDLSIQWGEISNLRTDKPIQIMLSGDMSARGIVKPGEGGSVSVKTDKVAEPITFGLAQITVINPKPPGPAVTLKGTANVGASVTSGNTDTKSLYIDGKLVARSAKNRFTIGGLMNKAEDSGKKTVDNATGYMEYDYFFKEKWYAYTNGTVTHDHFKDIHLRTVLGAGAGYQIFETPIRNLSLEAGLSYVNEDFNVAEDQGFAAGRWAVDFDHFFFNKGVQFFHSHEGVVSLENSKDLFIRSQTGFRFPLFKGLNTTAQLNWDYENNPSPGRERSDETYLLTLGYQWLPD